MPTESSHEYSLLNLNLLKRAIVHWMDAWSRALRTANICFCCAISVPYYACA